MRIDLKGVVCPVVTPFDEQNRVDVPKLRGILDFLLDHRIDGLMIAGTTGEGMSLSVEERKHLFKEVAEHVEDQVPVLAHTGDITTAATIEMTRCARDAGATAASIIVPYFYTFTDETLFNHYVSIAEAVPDFPIFLYAFPGNAKNDISPELLARLLEATDNIVGIKSSNADLMRFEDYTVVGGDDFSVCCGVDGLMLPALSLGASAQVSGNSNAFPDTFRSLAEAFYAGDMERAHKMQRQVNSIRAALKDGIHPAYYKAALELRGVPAGRVRPPMRELTAEEFDRLKDDLAVLGLAD